MERLAYSLPASEKYPQTELGGVSRFGKAGAAVWITTDSTGKLCVGVCVGMVHAMKDTRRDNMRPFRALIYIILYTNRVKDIALSSIGRRD